MRRQFTSFLGAFVSVGTTVFEREDEEPRVFFDMAGCSRRCFANFPLYDVWHLRASRALVIRLDEIDNVGIVLRQTVTFRLNHVFTPAFLSTLFVSFTRTEQLEDSVGTTESVRDRDDSFWRAGARASYALSRVVSLSLVYLYQHRVSTRLVVILTKTGLPSLSPQGFLFSDCSLRGMAHSSSS